MPFIRRTPKLPGITTRFAPRAVIPAYIQTSLVSPRAAMNGAEARRQMASDMREAALREGGMTRDDLQLLGWTAAQIDTHGAAAREQAQRLSGMT